MINTLLNKTKKLFKNNSDKSDNSDNSDKKNKDDLCKINKKMNKTSNILLKFNLGEKKLNFNFNPNVKNIFKVFNSFKFLNILRNNYIYESKNPETNIIINHNLNTENIIVQLWIKSKNNLWVNDKASISILDKNNIKIELLDPKIIKIIIKKSDYDIISKILKENNFNLDAFDEIRKKLLEKN